MEIKEKLKNYYKSHGVKINDDYAEGILQDKERLTSIIRIYKPIELKAMNYIFDKPEDNKIFSKIESEFCSRTDLFDKKKVNISKFIWKNKDNTAELNRLYKIINKELTKERGNV